MSFRGNSTMSNMRLYILLSFIGITFARNPYIIGGDEVTEVGKWPWQGSLRVRHRHSCGISLISEDWGVTAAHCVGANIKDFSFMFGSNNRWATTFLVRAEKVIKHEKYNKGEGAYPNDIAVVKFQNKVSGNNIKTIPLAPKGSSHIGNGDCWITGWGLTESGGSIPDYLREAHIKVYTRKYCGSVWGDDLINDGHVCIGEKDKGRSCCNGDSGGPLVCKVNGRYELVGATSFSSTGCDPDFPAGYSGITYFRDWIKEKTGV